MYIKVIKVFQPADIQDMSITFTSCFKLLFSFQFYHQIDRHYRYHHLASLSSV